MRSQRARRPAGGRSGCPGQAGDVVGVLDTLCLVEAAWMGGDDVRAVEDAHLVEGREDDESAAHMGVRHAVVRAWVLREAALPPPAAPGFPRYP